MTTAERRMKAKDLITEHARDYLTAKVKIPLGNPALKNVHTNQFLFMDFPSDFSLENWETIAKALNSSETRYGGYSKTRWYIEGCTIDVDVKGKAEMSLDMNAFASTTKEFTDGYRALTKAYEDAVNKTVSSTKAKTTSSTKTTTNAVKGTNSTLKGGQGTTIDNLVKKIVGNETNDLKKAKLIHEWLRQNVIYKYYKCAKYFTPEKCYNNKSHLNCADTATLTCAMMLSAGLKAYCVHRKFNGGHFWCVIEINGKKYASDQTGRESASMAGSAWNTVWKQSGRTGNGGSASYSRKCGSRAKCVGQ